MKVVLNGCYGGFGLSDAAIRLYLEKKGIEYWERPSKYASLGADFFLCTPEQYEELYEKAQSSKGRDRFKEVNALYFTYHDMDRWDPTLVEVVEELGDAANGRFAALHVVDIPFEDGDGWYIDEYDGVETINESHRSWS